jgi:hypothetical protein
MEWQNVTAGYDLDAMWIVSHDHIMRRGYAWVGVSAQQVGIHQPATGLKAWSPTRYGSLDVTQGGTIPDDSLCYDIFSQAAQAMRNPVGIDPMGGLHVKRIIATGASQSARRLGLYHNTIHPLAGAFDAFFLAVGGRLLRTDLDVKVFKVLSETDVAGIHAALRQPDSDRLRRWEVAGSAHLDFHMSQHLRALRDRDGIPASSPACDLPPFSRIPMYCVANAAMEHLVRWVRQGTEPPTAPDIEALTITPESAEIARDSFGKALGGIRLSQHAVPTATNTGTNSGPGFCRLFGWFQPFDAATLDALYPDHQPYLSLVMQVTHENMRLGYILPSDAGATIEEAAESDIGRY